jgi:TPR repeat protein
MAIAAVVLLATGFLIGIYRKPIEKAVADIAIALRIVHPAMDVNAAESAFQKGNYEQALRIARPLAEQGDARAQSLLGRVFSRGRGVQLDEAEAARWFRRAAEQGNAAAQFSLGNMYSEGRGVPQDFTEAAKWYRASAEQGDPQAQYNLGLAYAKGEGVPQDNINAHAWFNIAASRFPSSDAAARNLAISNREAVAKKMTPEEITQAQQRTHDWAP